MRALCVAQRRVYVTDQGNDRVSVFEPEKLTWLFSFGATGKGPGQFREPRCALAAARATPSKPARLATRGVAGRAAHTLSAARESARRVFIRVRVFVTIGSFTFFSCFFIL